MWPISVPMPVVVTIISPRPRVTAVFMNARQCRSPIPTSAPSIAARSLSTGTLSPVSAPSSISSVAATNSRPSAGTRLPASISTMSPGTSPSESISIASPSRRTRAMFFNIFSSAPTLAAAFASPRRLRTALNTVSPISTIVVPHSPVTITFTIAAPSSRICMKSWYCRSERVQPGLLLLRRHPVGAVLLEATLRLRGAQADRRIDAELLGDLVGAERVPVGRRPGTRVRLMVSVMASSSEPLRDVAQREVRIDVATGPLALRQRDLIGARAARTARATSRCEMMLSRPRFLSSVFATNHGAHEVSVAASIRSRARE